MALSLLSSSSAGTGEVVRLDLALSARQLRLFSVRVRRWKRVLDVLLAAVSALLALPLGLLIALAIKLESRGPVFFSHQRIGKGQTPFRLWKFRTMAVNGDDILRQHLEENPERILEWRQARKLRGDPRVTRVGAILRRTSLDELPQLWNVLRGEMSLVGPRPIVEDEISKYGAAFAFYCRALPGITGLWQVSGRNELSYGQRVALDLRYIRAWSFALDLAILCKTIGAVVSGRGAY